jgi:hypothetical protein
MNGARWFAEWENRVYREAKAEGWLEGWLQGWAEGWAKGRLKSSAARSLPRKAARGPEIELRGLRIAVTSLCRQFGIALSPTREARLESMRADELKALCLMLNLQKRWPRRGDAKRLLDDEGRVRITKLLPSSLSALEGTKQPPLPAAVEPTTSNDRASKVARAPVGERTPGGSQGQ